MSPQAAKELLDLIMLDDYVTRKKALNNWSRRWIATLQLDYTLAPSGFAYNDSAYQALENVSREVLIVRMVKGLLANAVPALRWTTSEDGSQTRVELHVVLQEPRTPV